MTRWREGGTQALLSKGPVSKEKLSAKQWQRLETELLRGPLAWGYDENQCWTLARVKTLIGRLFHIGYTIEGVGKPLHRHGWSVPAPCPGAGRGGHRCLGDRENAQNYVHPDLDLTADAWIRTQTALGRLAEPGQIAAAYAFLASDDATYLTGRTLAADGGFF
ncbi:SDR family oxidoreductase [Nonomuraea jabiensis]|uniref:SDR family oxidoreductase n=1 Tax=Nonomuraea jabiensis TaxID=882448 RepID=UPI003446365A